MPVYLDNLVFVHIPKCGGTSMTNALEEYVVKSCVEQGLPNGYPGEVRRLRKHESAIEIKDYYVELFGEDRWDNAIKFSVIRNPADRIVSWFKYRQRKMAEITALPGWWEGGTPESGKYVWDAIGSAVDYLSVEEAESGKNCHHWTDKNEVKEFLDLNFHEYINKATVFRHSGCENSDCPYHLAQPQVNWITDLDGNMAVDAIFRLEEIEEVYNFLPDLPKLGRENAGSETLIDYRKQLTKESLRVILDFYAKDFELYALLRKEQEEDHDDAVDSNS
jgi:hypothetical protein